MLTETVIAHVAPEDLTALRRVARAEDRSISSLVRLAIRHHLEKHEAASAGRPHNAAHGGARHDVEA